MNIFMLESAKTVNRRLNEKATGQDSLSIAEAVLFYLPRIERDILLNQKILKLVEIY